MEGRIGDEVMIGFRLEARGAQHLAGRRHIGRDHFELLRKTVPPGIPGGKRSERGIDLDRGYQDARNARQQTKPGDADARADIEHALARFGRNGCGEKHRVAPCPVPAARLDNADAAAEKIVGRSGARLPLRAVKLFCRRR